MTEETQSEKNKHSISVNIQNINIFPVTEWQVNRPLTHKMWR